MRFLLVILFCLTTRADAQPLKPAMDTLNQVSHGYANANGVKIHYAAMGDPGTPLVVMIHGFPDFWYSWRHQMQALSKDFYAVAIDQRGYNLSDKPAGEAQYDMRLLVGDVVAVIKSLGREKAVVVGHDWGGAVAWSVATYAPEVVDRLIILNLPHLRGLRRELATNPEQQRNSQYARNFLREGSERALTAEGLAAWVTDPEARKVYVEAFRRSDLAAMMHYYRRNYPREPYTPDTTPITKVKAPVLQIHGLRDQYLLPGALNGTWDYLEKDWTLVTVPQAGHFVQQDAADVVSRTMLQWLRR